MDNNYEVLNIVTLEMDRDAEAWAESHQSESSLSNSLESRGDADSNQSECEVWTNEKHSSYLDSLENSFIRQLYSLLGREETRSVSRARRPLHSHSHKSTHQVRHGCRHKVNFRKKRAFLEMSSDAAADQGNVLRNSVRHEYPPEASGQNFREDVREKGCNSGMSRKRRREANYDESSLDDQVVP